MKQQTRSAAILTVYNAPGMTKSRRQEVATWIRWMATRVAGDFTAGAKKVPKAASFRFASTRTILTLKSPNKYSAKGRRDIAAWLRRHAKFLEQHGNQFSKRFTGRYLYA